MSTILKVIAVTAVGDVIGIVLAGTGGPLIMATIGAMAITAAAAIAMPTAMGPD